MKNIGGAQEPSSRGYFIASSGRTAADTSSSQRNPPFEGQIQEVRNVPLSTMGQFPENGAVWTGEGLCKRPGPGSGQASDTLSSKQPRIESALSSDPRPEERYHTLEDFSVNLMRLYSHFNNAWADKRAILAEVALLVENFLKRPDLHTRPVSDYVHLANKVSKFVQLEVCKKALRWLAAKVVDHSDSLDKLTCAEAGLLVNALIKNKSDEVCHAAILCITRSVKIDADSSLADRTRYIALSVSALSQCTTIRLVQIVALNIAEELINNALLLQSLNGQEASSILNAVNKWPYEEQAQKIMLCLIRQIARDKSLQDNMDPQAVGNTLVSLRRFSAEPEVRETALGLADRVVYATKNWWPA